MNESLQAECRTDALGQCLSFIELLDATGFLTSSDSGTPSGVAAYRCSAVDSREFDVVHVCAHAIVVDCDVQEYAVFDPYSGAWLSTFHDLDYPDETHYCCNGARTTRASWGDTVDMTCQGSGLLYEYTWRDFAETSGGSGSR